MISFLSLVCISAEVIYVEDLEPETWTAPKHSAFMSYEMNLTVSKIELHLVTDVEALQDFLGKEMQT